jgi:cytoskeleton protein RodZ
MESVGARLKKKRLEQGISIEQVHNKTRIHLDILKSIEDDDFVNLNPIYIKGFLKLYCQFLGVNPEDYIPCYKETKVVIKPSEAEERKDHSYLKKPVSADKPFNPRILVTAVSFIVLIFLAIGLINLVRSSAARFSGWSKKNKAVAHARVKPAKKPAAAVKPAGLKPAVKDKINEGIALNNSAESELRVGLHALEDCWVQAKLDGKTVFQSILKKGRDENWKAKDKIELILGSAGGVRLEVNGKAIPALGRRDQVLKDIIITKNGLKIGR